MQSISTFLPKMPTQQVRGPQRPMLTVMTDLPPLNGPAAPRAQRPMLNGPAAPRAQRPMLAVMTDLPPLNGPPAPRGPQRPRPMLAVTTDHPYVPEVVWIPRHALLQYPDRKKCITKSKYK